MNDYQQNYQAKPAEKETRMWAAALHVSQLLTFSLVGIVVPIVIWMMKKDESPQIDQHGRNVVNWMISALIYGFICFLLCFVFVGFILFPILGILAIVYPIVGAIKAYDGQVWKYPLTITFI